MAFLKALDELTGQKRNVSHSERASNYAPKLMKAAGFADQFSKADLKRAMNLLFGENAIVANAELWRGGDRKWVSVLPAARRARASRRRPVWTSIHEPSRRVPRTFPQANRRGAARCGAVVSP